MRKRFIVLVVILLLASAARAPLAQVMSVPGMGPNRGNPSDRADIEAEEARQKAANKERQTSLQRDTDQLYKLATELKQSVDKSNENMLSLDVIKKAEQIEKLARSVKDKMKADAYMPIPGPQPITPARYR